MQSKKNWYVIYTKPKWEKKTTDLLLSAEVEAYCPLHKVIRQWSDRKKTMHLPLFTSYVFICTEKERLSYIKNIDGVINFVHWLGKPAIVKDEEIQVIKEFLSTHNNVEIQQSNVKVRDKIQILYGPFSEREGEIVALRNQMVKVSLPSLGYVLIAEVKMANVKLISQYNTLNKTIKHNEAVINF